MRAAPRAVRQSWACRQKFPRPGRAPGEARSLRAIDRFDAHAHHRAPRHALKASDIEARIDEAAVELMVRAEWTRTEKHHIGVAARNQVAVEPGKRADAGALKHQTEW